jgi:hypothetical protein
MTRGVRDVAPFISELIAALGGHPTPATVRALETWQRMEGGSTNNPDTYNFLNTTLRVPGSHGTGNVAGVQAYPDFATGLRATIATLRNGYYDPIIQAIRTGNWTSTPALAHALKTWSGGGYSAILGAAGGGGAYGDYKLPPPTGALGGSVSPSAVAKAPVGSGAAGAAARVLAGQQAALRALSGLLAQSPSVAMPTLTLPTPDPTPTVPAAPPAPFASPLLTTQFGNPLGSLGPLLSAKTG